VEATVAVIPAEGARAPSEATVARLEVMLSNEEGISPVERAVIRKVLSEQRLSASGLTDPASALTIGRLAAADLFLFVERIPKAKPPTYRIRIVETKTGIALAEDTLEETSLAGNMSSVPRIVRAAARKLGVPFDRRHYVGLLGFRSEEPGHLLDGLAEGLGMLLAHDLGSSPSVVLLDREHLDRLREEKELTGIELKLRTSAVLVEGGIRRLGGKGEFGMTVLLRGFAAGVQKLSVTAPAGDHAAARRALARAVLEKLGTQAPLDRPIPAGEEAATFARRVPALLSSGEIEAAVRAAEAAYTLAPAYETSFWAARAWSETAEALQRTPSGYTTPASFKMGRSMPTKEKVRALAAHLRARTLALEFYREHARRFDEGEVKHVKLRYRTGTGKYDLLDAVSRVRPVIVAKPDEREVARLREQLAELDRELFRFKTRYYAGHCPEAEDEYWDVWARALRDFRSLYPGRPDLQVRFIRESIDVFAGPPFKVEEGKPSHRRVSTIGEWVCSLRGQRLKETPESERRALIDLCRELSRHEDPLVRVAGYQGLARLDEDALASTRAALDTFVRDLPPDHVYRRAGGLAESSIAILVDLSQQGILAREDPEAFDSYCRKVFLPMLEKGEGGRLNEWVSTLGFDNWLHTLARRGHAAEAAALSRRAVQVLSRSPLQRAKRNARWVEEQGIKYAKAANESAMADPVWSDYVIEPVRVRPPSNTKAAFLHGERMYFLEQSSACHDDALVLNLWSQEFPAGPRREKIATASAKAEGDWDGWVKSSALLMDRLYVATDVGLFMLPLTGGKARVFTERDGLPGNCVESLASYRGKLYLGFGETVRKEKVKAGLACLDPERGSWSLIAGTGAAEVRCGLDGGTNYEINDILADKKRGHLWLAVKETRYRREGRSGLWRYTPETGRLEHVLRGGSYSSLVWEGDMILCSADGVILLDPDRLTRIRLIGSRNSLFGNPLPWQPISPVILDGDRIFTVKRTPEYWLYLLRRGKPPVPFVKTPDGKEFDRVDVCLKTAHGIYVADWRAAYLIRRKGQQPKLLPVPRLVRPMESHMY
jgi:hypothetical protein